MSQGDKQLNVLIAGGGVAGLEALLALRDLAGDRVDVTVLAPEEQFVYRPIATGAPFGRGHQQRRPLDGMVREMGGRLVRGSLAEVDDANRTAITADGERLPYDALLVAVGAGSRPAFPAATTWTPERDPEVFGGLLRDLDEGYTKKVAFVVPPGAYWPLPAYELALMTAWQAWGMGQNDVGVTVYTYEDAPLEAFGTEAAVALRQDLAEARVEVQTGVFAREEDGRIVLQPGHRAVEAQRIVALPEAVARDVRGLPADARGFIPVDLYGRVPQTEAVWAAGDAIAFPIKQGGLAAQEADAAAEAIAAQAGAQVEPRPFQPVLRGVVLTGRGRQWMRRDLESGDATVAHDTGSAERHALWWPPTKIAGRYLAPYLAALGRPEGGARPPDGQPVELDVQRELPGAADALTLARLRTGQRPSTS